MKYLIWRNVSTDKNVVMELEDGVQICMGGMFISWADETELYLRYFDYDKFEVTQREDIMIIVEVKE